MSCSTSTCGQMEEIRIKIIYWQLCNSVVTLRYYLFICLSDYIIDTVDNIRFFYLKRRSSNKKKTWKIFKVCCKTAWQKPCSGTISECIQIFYNKNFLWSSFTLSQFFWKIYWGKFRKGRILQKAIIKWPTVMILLLDYNMTFGNFG